MNTHAMYYCLAVWDSLPLSLPSAPPVDPPTSKRCTRSTIPSETTPLGVGDWLTDKDIVCWLNHGPIRTLILGLILSLVPMTVCETMLYWLSPN